MTITLNRVEAQSRPVDRSDAHKVLSTLHSALDVVVELDPDLLHSHTGAGHALVQLAGTARAAAAALGADPGTCLREAPGVVVVRDLVAALSLLELAAARAGALPDPRLPAQLTRRAEAAFDRLLLSVPATA